MSQRHKQGMYLGAAAEVLGRIGRPMHYESITRAAIALGILDSTSKSPGVAMVFASQRRY